MKIILASASPRRRELLAQIIPEFEVIPSEAAETLTEDTPQEIVLELAVQKAEEVARRLFSSKSEESIRRISSSGDESEESADALVIGADTIVVSGGLILGKPVDEDEAFRMLGLLSGNTHQVYTGVCLIRLAEDTCVTRTFYEKTDVEFYPMMEDEIREYIATGDPMDKAGAYGIQSGCAKYIRGICGDYNNVVGLPVARLYHELKDPELLFTPIK